MHPDYNKFDPLAPPDWRYQRTLTLLDGEGGPHPPTRYDDRYIRTYYRLLRIQRDAGADEVAELQGNLAGPPASPVLMKALVRDAGLWYADRLHHSADSETLARIQARILAREDDAQIAQRWATIPATFEWYEKIFFSVRARIDNADWIRNVILGAGNWPHVDADGASTQCKRQRVLKWFAYFGGSRILEAMLTGVVPAPPKNGERSVESWFGSSLKALAKIKGVAALAALECDDSNAMQLLKLIVGSAETDASEVLPSGYEESLKAALAEIPWEIALRREPSAFEKRFMGAAEPRSHERLMIAAGQAPPDLVAYYKAHPELRQYPDLPLDEETP